MGEWKEVTLRDICTDISYGYTASASEHPVGPKFLRITDIVKDRIDWTTVPFCHIDKQIAPKYKLQVGDIVIARTGATTGYNAIIKEPTDAVFASYLIRYRMNREIADPNYIAFLLKSYEWRGFVDNVIGGSAQPGANAQQFADFAFSLPPLPEQRAIAEVLSSLDDKIDLLHRQNQTLEALAETLFRQWFVEEAEEGWEESGLSEIAEHVKESVNPSSFGDAILKHYSIPAYDDGQVPKQEQGASIKSNKFKVKSNTVLVSKLNPRFPRVWAVFGEIDEELSISSTEFQGVRPINSGDLPFVYYFLKSSDVRKELIGAAGGTSGSHQRFDPQVLFDIEMKIPPIQKRNQFNLMATEFLKKINYNRGTIRTLTQMRITLLPKLMSGEVRVPSDN